MATSAVVATSARPCKTILYFSTARIFYPYIYISHPGNPNSHFFTLIFSSTTSRFPDPSSLNLDLNPNFNEVSIISLIEKRFDLPDQSYPWISNSLRDRAIDICYWGLDFWVGCGGLTAALMYFFWAICSQCALHGEDADTSDDDEVKDIKVKLGYVMIPSQPNVADDDLKKSAPAV